MLCYIALRVAWSELVIHVLLGVEDLHLVLLFVYCDILWRNISLDRPFKVVAVENTDVIVHHLFVYYGMHG